MLHRAFFLLLALLCSHAALAAEPEAPPPPAHDDERFEMEGGVAETYGAFLAIGYRYGLHDFLDPVSGYPKNTTLDILHLKLRLPLASASGLWIDDLTLIRIASLSPTEISLPERSYEFELGARTERSQLCDHCVAGRMIAGLGATFQTGQVPLELFVLGDATLAYGPKFFGSDVKPGLGPHAGIRWRVTPNWIGMIDGRYVYTFFADHPDVYDFGTEWRFSPVRDLAVGLKLRRFPDAWEFASDLLFYF